ncbi:hypothetical protein D9M69_441400 [compost metagenome]
MQVLETQFAAAFRQHARRLRLAHLDRLLLQLHDPPQADGHPLQRHVQAEQALHRTHRHAQVGGEGDQRAELPTALHHPVAADDESRRARQRGQRAGQRVGEELGDLQLQQLAHVALAKAFQALRLAPLLAGGLDELHRRQGLDQERRHVRRALAQAAHVALDLAAHPAQPQHFEGDQHGQQQRQLPGQQQHQGHRAEQADHAGHRGEQRVDGEALDFRDVAVQPRQQVADPPPAEERRRQLLQVAVQVVAQGEQDAPGQARVQVAVETGEQRAEDADGDHRQRHLHQHREVLGQQAVVDQQLGQPGLRQHQQRSAQRQAEQRQDGAQVRAHEAVQPAQRTLQQFGVAGFDQSGNETDHRLPKRINPATA